MSISLNAVALHQIVKNEQEELVVHYGAHQLPIQPAYEVLVEEIHRAYQVKTKGYGQFNEESAFKASLVNYRAGELPFYNFSCSSSDMLRNELSKYPFADQGTLVFAEYQSLATDYLLVGLVSSNSGMTVMDNLSLSSTAYLDIAKMDLVAVVNLSTFETDPSSNRYLSFIKGRVGRKVSDFFLDFLQAEVGLDVKVQNQVLMQAVADFCSDSKLEKVEVVSFKKQVFDFCSDAKKHGDEVQISELSGELPAFNGVSFDQYTETQGYELAESFPVDSGCLRKLTKFIGAGGGINISFDSLLLGERVFYDPETDTLTIKGTPPNLRDQLTRQGGAK
ncbi:nucleoid-associated protein YejK [Vibrio anguillarum]|uniref:nucleoid-associated protein YejK n=1 Tax=Vibrio anguillarum TaxID=55601 RepID=UPI00097E3E2E|nr:nucleoid-associated protein YejK [Vibrio anguillarum]MBT2909659.1 nucleoid-associated protein YejK [Vibrio anguillarum]MBT2942490.1 nucleoid-associated protein YejK [Vibrio anguillarum]MBT2950686.1 nucleoid-associated protein YejK [Vibrio anguillarum]MBT2979507.1 nucleoid-associated protein YejK [Vibrio anguillarum]